MKSVTPEGMNRSDEILARLLTLHPRSIDLTLERVYRLLAKLDNPQLKLPPVIHVAGTNGKGSVVAYMRAMLEAAGQRVHVYTSPHLVHFNERIRLKGALISHTYLAEILEECEQANGGEPITFFEITTVAAILAFSRVPADICLLEVGLGGRLDATNVVPNPAMTVITPVHFDHEAYLGNTLAKIAAEKAGIIKQDCPVVVGLQPPSAFEVIKRIGAEQRAPLFSCRQTWTVEEAHAGHMVYKDRFGTLKLPLPALPGRHQIQNAGIAIAALRHQGAISVPETALRAGLEWVRWPARLQQVETGPLHEALPEGSVLYVDGGHNVAAAKAVKKYFDPMLPPDVPLYMIAGMLKTKNLTGFLQSFAGLVDTLYAIPMPGDHDAFTPEEVVTEAKSLGIKACYAQDIPSAVHAIGERAQEGPPPVVLICGSLYVAGEALGLSELPPQ